jgi:hypothetical protein
MWMVFGGPDTFGYVLFRNLAKAADDAEFGRVVRVHRRYPGRYDLQDALPGLIVVLTVTCVPVLALWLNDFRWLPAVLFSIGCIVGAILVAPWYRAATRREQYAVAEHGVLVWWPRTRYVSSAVAWSAVRTVQDVCVTWRDTDGNDQELVIPPVTARRDLLSAFDNRAPVATWTPGRVAPPTAAAAAVLLFFGPLVWFGAVPTAVELIWGERPRDVFALERMCQGGDPFRGAARYHGAGPHPTVTHSPRGDTHVMGAETPSGRGWPAGTAMQLIACGQLTGHAKPEALLSCAYSAIQGGGSLAVNVYQGRYQYEVREARTGRHVSTITVDGSRDPGDCAESRWVGRSPDVLNVDLEPTKAQLEAAFGSLVNGTAPD